MKVVRSLTWEPTFGNEIDIEEDAFTITLSREAIEIVCDWDYGCGHRGTESFSMPINKLKDLIKELEAS